MKKFATLVLAAGLVVSSFTGASAGEFKPNAQIINQFEGGNAGSLFNKDGMGYDEHFKASIRLRLGFDYIVSENLSATFLMQIGDYDYGSAGIQSNDNGSLDGYLSDPFRVRLAYVDWMIPTTDVQVRMGFQPVALPAFAFGSAVLDARGTGVVVAAPINENISLDGIWIRAASNDDGMNVTVRGHDDADIFALAADFDYDGFRIAPWAMYAMAGSQVGQFGELNSFDHEFSAWYLGASFELSMFDPFMFALDAYYSDASWDGAAGGRDLDMDGYFVAASASYKTQWGTPALKGWYASGDDTDKLVNHPNTNDYLGQPATIVGAFAATSIMFDDQVMDNGLANYRGGNPAGTWGVLLEWADFSFIEKLSHTARIAYMGGTNDVPNGTATTLEYLGDDDDVLEINFNSTYEIYKNLSTALELGWLTADFDRHLNADEDDDIFRAALSFTYTF